MLICGEVEDCEPELWSDARVLDWSLGGIIVFAGGVALVDSAEVWALEVLADWGTNANAEGAIDLGGRGGGLLSGSAIEFWIVLK